MTAKQFTSNHPEIVASIEWSERNPNMNGMPAGSNHYKLVIRNKNNRKQTTVYYSKGPALHGTPTLEEVIECLAMDVSYIRDGFEEFRDQLDYDLAEARRVFNTIERQASGLYRVFGFDAYREFEQIEEANE